MKIKGTKKYNYAHNMGRTLPERMINGQGVGDVSRLRYGICPMSFNGCEVISVYNALRYIGKPQPLQEVAFFLERYKVLLGFFGCNVYRLGKALEHFGAEYERIKIPADSDEAFIVSFWTGKRFLSSIHTVFCVRERGRIRIYNRYNSCPTVRYAKTEQEIFGRHKPIALYAIKK